MNEKQQFGAGFGLLALAHGRFFGLVALLSLSLIFPVAGWSGTYLSKEGAASTDVPSSWYDVGNGKAPFSWTYAIFFTDHYPGGADVGGFNLGAGYTATSSGGQVPVDSTGKLANISPENFNGPLLKTFGAGKISLHAVYTGRAGDGSDRVDEGASDLVPSSKTKGATVCQVVTTDPKKPGSFIPLPGAKLEMYERPSSFDYTDGSHFPTGSVLSARGVRGLTYAVFGSDDTGAVKTDYPYPSGLAVASYSFRATCDGYKPALGDNDSMKQGIGWPGKGCTIILVPVNSSDASTVTATASDPTGLNLAWDGVGSPPVPSDPGGSAPGGSAPGGDGSTGFFSGFWDRLQKFFSDMFTLQQTDVDELGKIKDKFAGYGPLGFPSSVMREFNNAFLNASGPDGSDPHYWDFPLTLNLGAAGQFGSAYPAGYDPNKAYHAPVSAPVYVTSLFPDHFDLAPYADYVLRSRFIALLAIWSVVAFSLVKRFWPDLHL